VFLRRNRRRVQGELQEYWTPCESVHTEGGPRQRVVATLGKLAKDDLQAGWDDIEALLEGRVRKLGSVFLGLAHWRRLGLHKLLGSIIEPGREKVALLLAHLGLRLPKGSRLVENVMGRTRR
jgi:hypothetical protein